MPPVIFQIIPDTSPFDKADEKILFVTDNLRNRAHLILEFAQEGGVLNAG